MAKPIVAVTMGDPAGVGPEVVLKALASPAVRRACRALVLGDYGVLERTLKTIRCDRPLTDWERQRSWRDADGIVVHSLTSLSLTQCKPGRPSRECGEAVYRYITEAAKLALSGAVDAMATAPINKKVLQMAGHRYPGHTELLAELGGARECRMMLLGERLKVVLVTVHLPF